MLPKHWSESTIGNVAAIDVRPKKDELDDETLASFVPMKSVEAETGRYALPEDKKVGDIKKGYTSMRDGDVIFAKVTPCMENGKAAVVRGLKNGIGFGSTEFYSLRPKDDILSEFLFYFLIQQEFRREAKRHMTGAVGLRRVPKHFITEHPIPHPPLPEQRRIVAQIEEIFSRINAGVASLRHAKAQLQRYRQSVLAAAVTGELTKQWREEHCDVEPAEQLLDRILEKKRKQWAGKGTYKEPVTPETSRMPRIPETWRWVRLDAICVIGSGMSVSKNRNQKNPIEVPYLRVANVQRGHLVLDHIKRMEIDKAQLPDFALKKGDVLFNEGGDRDKLGRGWVWEGQIESCITQNHVFRASPYDVKATLPKFISHWGNTFGQQFFLNQGTQTTNLASINKGRLSGFPVPIPPIAEQQQIVARVEARTTAIVHLESEIDRQITRAYRLRQSTLAAAFCGNISR